MLVIPAPGRAPRDPRTKLRIPREGVDLPDGDLDLVRLLADGDVVGAGEDITHKAETLERPGDAEPGEQIEAHDADGHPIAPAAETLPDAPAETGEPHDEEHA